MTEEETFYSYGDINNCRQNHPELIVRDLDTYAESNIIRLVLKYRGVNKWLRVRRLLIELKHRWRERIKQLQITKVEARARNDMRSYYKLVGYVEALTDCRQQIRALCHSPRCVDFPQSPKEFGDLCKLPEDFPNRPHKRWFWYYDGVKK